MDEWNLNQEWTTNTTKTVVWEYVALGVVAYAFLIWAVEAQWPIWWLAFGVSAVWVFLFLTLGFRRCAQIHVGTGSPQEVKYPSENGIRAMHSFWHAAVLASLGTLILLVILVSFVAPLLTQLIRS